MAGVRIHYLILVCFFSLQFEPLFAAFENVAVGKTAYQSSYLAGTPAGNAVDDNIIQSDAGLCILTNISQPYTWWEVDLGQEYFIHQVVIYFRTDWEWRRKGIQVYTSTSARQGNGGESCGLQITGRDDGSDINDITTRTCDVTGRYVTLYQDYNNPKGSTCMDFCEVVVKACPRNKYGADCDKLCADRKCARSDSSCIMWIGECNGGCLTGWKNDDCTIDINECQNATYPCDTNAVCGNTVGSYTCTCKVGFSGDGHTCTDVNECQTGAFSCDTNADCRNTVGSYTCACQSGYSGNGKICNDINECETGTYQCGTNADCGNTVGSYICTCKVGFSGDGHTCTACESDVKYGSNCIKSCSDRNCATTSSTCDAKTGACDGGCKQGWREVDCTQDIDECEQNPCGLNANCTNTAGSYTCACRTGYSRDEHRCTDINECLNQKSCDINADCTNTDGSYTCTCQTGYSGDGKNCTDVDECLEQKPCDTNASCSNTVGSYTCACLKGFSGDGKTCTACEDNVRYGLNCSKLCKDRKCSSRNSSCNSSTGTCDNGCQVGWNGSECTHDVNECTEQNPCDLKANCNNTDGSYTCVCHNGYSGDGKTCTDVNECTEQNPCDMKANCNNTDGSYTCVCHNGYSGDGKTCTDVNECTEQNPCDMKADCRNTDGSYTCVCHSGYTGDGKTCTAASSAGPDSTGIIAGVVAGIAVLIIVIIVIAVIMIRRRRLTKHEADEHKEASAFSGHRSVPKSMKETKLDNVYANVGNQPRPTPEGTEVTVERKTRQKTDSTIEEVDEQDNMGADGSEYYNISDFILPEGGVVVSELPRILENIRNQTGGFETEYKKLLDGFSSSYDESQILENKTKNRYVGYYPYDKNRVTLTMLPGISNSDYINASYLDAYTEKDYFIAAQAPNKKTLLDFWRMIWEKECGHIIMLTNLVEATKRKCEAYWSDTESMTLGALTIAVTEKEERSDYVYRKFCVTHKKSGKSKTFQQFHFTAWPDHGVPNVHDFIQFLYRVRETKPILPGPVLVHCSAGIGRTGTYIALDILLDQMDTTGSVDIKKVMKQMRDQRKGVVQTKDQYETIFVALLELARFGKTSLAKVEFLQKYAKQKGSMRMEKKTVDELAQEVVKLNETSYTDPPDQYQIWIDGRSDMFVVLPPSKLTKHGYLLIPEPEGAKDSFWKMVTENDSYTIITLSAESGDGLIPQTSQTLTHGKTTITALRQTSIIHEITEKTLQVDTKGDPVKREIQHYMITGWTPTTDSATLISCLTTISEQIQKQQHNSRAHPVTIVYRESEAKNAIMLCIANDILTGINVDNEVEIFNNIRRFQALLPNVKLTKEDFTFFCNLALFNLESSSMYANCPAAKF